MKRIERLFMSYLNKQHVQNTHTDAHKHIELVETQKSNRTK